MLFPVVGSIAERMISASVAPGGARVDFMDASSERSSEDSFVRERYSRSSIWSSVRGTGGEAAGGAREGMGCLVLGGGSRVGGMIDWEQLVAEVGFG